MAFSKGSLSLFYIYNVHLSSSRIFSTSTRPFPNTLKLFDTGERGKSFQICFSDILSSLWRCLSVLYALQVIFLVFDKCCDELLAVGNVFLYNTDFRKIQAFRKLESHTFNVICPENNTCPKKKESPYFIPSLNQCHIS